jgi:hypothetical protein
MSGPETGVRSFAQLTASRNLFYAVQVGALHCGTSVSDVINRLGRIGASMLLEKCLSEPLHISRLYAFFAELQLHSHSDY